MSETLPPAAIFEKHAQLYMQRNMDVSAYSSLLLQFCNTIPKENARVLDLACGPGNITAFLLEQRPELRLLGVDIAPSMIRLAKQNNPTAEFEVMDWSQIAEPDHCFDGVVCSFLLPYLQKSETKTLLTKISAALRNDGIVYLSFIEDSYTNSGIQTNSAGDRVYMYYYTLEDIDDLLAGTGLQKFQCERNPGTNGTTAVKEIMMLLRKGRDAQGTEAPPGLKDI